jgi:hypothetical protein
MPLSVAGAFAAPFSQKTDARALWGGGAYGASWGFGAICPAELQNSRRWPCRAVGKFKAMAGRPLQGSSTSSKVYASTSRGPRPATYAGSATVIQYPFGGKVVAHAFERVLKLPVPVPPAGASVEHSMIDPHVCCPQGRDIDMTKRPSRKLATPKLSYTVEDSAAALSISTSILWRLISHGLVKSTRTGASIRIPAEEVARLAREGVPKLPAGYKRKTVGTTRRGRPKKKPRA